MRCIFCLVEKLDSEFSNEHVFPAAIGGTMVIRTVCKSCNDYLGHSIDSHLTNHWLVQVQRHHLQLKGTANRVPNPFERGTLSDDPTQKIRYELDEDGRPERLYVVPQISREVIDNGSEKISMRVDAADRASIPGIVNKMRYRAGMPMLSDDEEDRLRESAETRIEQPWVSLHAVIDLKEYQRALLKVAYELACTWIGSRYLDDPIAHTLRSCILERDPETDWAAKHLVRGHITMMGENVMFPLWAKEMYSHIGFIAPDNTALVCYIRIFQTFEGVLQVSADRSRYPGFGGRFAAIDPQSGRLRDSTFEEELDRLTRDAD